MATTTVLVTQLAGQAWIRDADGNLTPLHEGMRIPADAQVITASGSSVQLQADGQPPLTLGESQDVALNADVFEDIPATEAAVPTAADPLVENLIAAINNGQDPLAELDPTAATLAGGGGAGSTFVRLASVLEATSPLALAYPRGAGEVPEDRRGGAATTIATAAVVDPTELSEPTAPVDPAIPPSVTIALTEESRVASSDGVKDLVKLDLDAVLTKGDAGDTMSDVTVKGLGDAKVVSIEHNGKTLVEGTDYEVKNGVLTLFNPDGVSLEDVKITLEVPHGSPALALDADVSAAGKYGSDSDSSALGVPVPPAPEPEVTIALTEESRVASSDGVKDLVKLDLDAVLTKGDAGDTMSDVTVKGLGDAKVVSIEHNGKTLVEGTDYEVKNGVLTLFNPDGVSLEDVKITLEVPHGSPALALDADVSAAGKYGSDSDSSALGVPVPPAPEPEVTIALTEESRVASSDGVKDLVKLDLDAVLTKGDAGDTMSDVTVKGLGDAKVVSIEHNGKTLVEGTDYEVKNGVLTLFNPDGVSLEDVKITLEVPHGSPALTLDADVSAAGKYGSDSDTSALTVTVPPAPEPEILDITGGQITVAEGDLAKEGGAVATGSFTVTTNKDIASITIAGKAIDVADIADMVSGKTPIPAPYGELIITSFTKTADGYQVEYEYRLSGAVQHDPAKNEDIALDVELEISVTSTTGATESSNISVTVEDDVPEFSGSEDIHTGNTVGEFTGDLTFSKGADSDGFGLKIDGISNLPSGWTYKASGDGGSASVFDATGKEVFQITLKQDGSYTVKQLAELSQTEPDGFGKGDLKSGNYKDGLSLGDSGLLITASNKNGSTPVNVSGQGIGGGNNHLQSGDKLNFAFDEAVSDFTINIGRNLGTDPGKSTIILVNGTPYEVNFSGNSWVISAKDLGISDGIHSVTLVVQEGAKFTVGGGEWHSMPTDVEVNFDVNVKGTDGDGDTFNGAFNVSNATKPTNPTDPTGPTDPADKEIPTPDIALTQVSATHVPGTDAQTTVQKGEVSITFKDGQVTVTGMPEKSVTDASSGGGVSTTSHAVVVTDDAFNHLTGSGTATLTGAWNQWTNQPVDILVLPGSKDSYVFTNLEEVNGNIRGTITIPGVPGGLTFDRFTGIVFGDGQTIGSMNGSTVTTTEATPAYDQVVIELDAWVAESVDASDRLDAVTITGLDGVTITSIQNGNTTLVEGTDYRFANGELTLLNPNGIDLKDVHITLKVPEGHAPLNLAAEVTASNDHGTSDPVQAPLHVEVAHSGGTEPVPEPESGVVNAPEVQLDVSSREVETTVSTPKDPLEGTTAVNGGATDPSGNGFNLDAAGNVVAVGANVRVWGTYSTKGVDGSGKTPINDFDHDGDGKSDILVYKNGEFSLAQYGENLIRIGYDNNGESNANANNRPGSEASTDLFLLHSQSGYWKANDGPDGKDSGHWSSFGNFTGNKVQYVDGKTAPDYVILIGDAAGKSPDHAPNFNRNDQINVLDTFTISGVVGSGNSVEGVFSGGQVGCGWNRRQGQAIHTVRDRGGQHRCRCAA